MNKEFEKWANGKIKKYQKILLLQHFRFDFGFDKEMKKETGMTCEFRYPYLDVEISYGTKAELRWKKKKLSLLENVIIHEMIHVITDELYSKATGRFLTRVEIEDARERTTDHIANIISSLVKLK